MKHAIAVEAFCALGHEHRLSAYRLLVQAGPEGLPAGAIATRLALPPSSLTFHLQQLENAGLIAHVRRGRQLIYSADFAAMNGLVAYLTENCCARSGGAGASCAPLGAPAPRAERGRRLRRSA